jgi:hypothetical protein
VGPQAGERHPGTLQASVLGVPAPSNRAAWNRLPNSMLIKWIVISLAAVSCSAQMNTAEQSVTKQTELLKQSIESLERRHRESEVSPATHSAAAATCHTNHAMHQMSALQAEAELAQLQAENQVRSTANPADWSWRNDCDALCRIFALGGSEVREARRRTRMGVRSSPRGLQAPSNSSYWLYLWPCYLVESVMLSKISWGRLLRTRQIRRVTVLLAAAGETAAEDTGTAAAMTRQRTIMGLEHPHLHLCRRACRLSHRSRAPCIRKHHPWARRSCRRGLQKHALPSRAEVAVAKRRTWSMWQCPAGKESSRLELELIERRRSRRQRRDKV